MHIRDSEVVLKTVKRHRLPYILNIAKISIIALPIYFIIFKISDEIGTGLLFILMSIVSFFVGVIIAVISFDYLLDKLIITNKRVIWINWKSIFTREEHEAELLDVQDIETRAKGILTRFKILDYGFLEIETASSKTCISFHDCPNPDGIKHFILVQMGKEHGGVREKQHTPPHETDWSVN